ncbi:MAG: 3-phosphoshikimate 1-carboxyvinyltransferase [Pyrinomonadaceae bacterium]
MSRESPMHSTKNQNRKITPAKSLRGIVILPGDKSISHRAAMLASIAEGTTRIENYAASADCSSTLNCVEALGVQVVRNGSIVTIKGRGKHGLSTPLRDLDCGNSGTTMRLLSGILAGQPITTTLIGDESLQKRPMKRIIEPLSLMGANISSTDGKAPLVVKGRRPLDAIEYQPPVASAQIKSCVLLAGLFGEGVTSVIEPVPTRDHTEQMLRWFGVDVTTENGTISLSGDAVLTARDIIVPGDVSAAAFFAVAAACLDGSTIMMSGVGVNRSRRAILTVLQNLGAKVEVSTISKVCNESVADIRVTGGLDQDSHRGTPVIRGETIANLIDEIPILAVFGTQLEGGIEIRDAAELRVKESDRIATVVENLRRMGAEVTEFDDGMRIERSKLHGAVIDSYGDHRIAMAFAVAGLFAEGETEIIDADCASVSFPGFFEMLEAVTVRV